MSVRTVGHTALRAAFWTAGMALALPNRAIAAQITPPDYGFQWSTIGTPGNRGLLASEATFERNIGRGSVDHTYRLAQTEITNAQWLQFVQAYGPYYLQDHPTHDQITALTGDGIDYLFGPWVMSPSTNPNAPANMGWRYAAMYCNWLCNGKRTDRAAFETGAYNVSTFTQNTDGSLNDQLVHTPGAAFWIPTLDEWFKAAYFDPNMVGPDGQLGAYQKFVGGSDSPLPAGDPASGGLTNVNCDGPTSVASYPACGPWGLFDQSGGVSEWTETMAALNLRNVRFVAGSRFVPHGDGFNGWADLNAFTVNSARSDLYAIATGLRIASSVPGPGGFSLFCVANVFLLRRRVVS